MDSFSIAQTEYFVKFQRAAGRRVFCYKRENGTVLNFVEADYGKGFKVWRGIGADLNGITKGDAQGVFDLAKENGAFCVRFEGNERSELVSVGGNGKKVFDEVVGGGATKSPRRTILPRFTIILDLKKSEEELLAQMKRKGRYNIKKASEEIVVKKLENPSQVQIDEFYELILKTAKRDSFSSHNKDYYSKMLSAMNGHCALFAGFYKQKMVCAIIVLYDEKNATYYYGASDHEYRHLMAPYLTQLEAIKDAKARGCEVYDFMGVGSVKTPLSGYDCDAKDLEFEKKDPLFGVSEFKQKFGGSLIAFAPAFDLVICKPKYALFNIISFLKRTLKF